MYAIALLSILASGYYYLSTHPLYSYKIHRYDGQKLYLDSAVKGIGFMLTSFLITLVIYFFLPQESRLYVLIKTITRNPESFSLYDFFSITAAIGSYILVYLKRSIYIIEKKEDIIQLDLELLAKDKNHKRLDIDVFFKYYLMNKVFCDSPLDHLFLKCLNDKTILMFHLEDRKVYVGSVTKMGEPTEDKGLDQEIEIKPIFSGHRATETMEVFLKTEYRKGDNIKITIKLDACLICDSAGNDNFYKAGNWSKAGQICQNNAV